MRILCFGDSNTYGYDPRSYFGDRYDAQNRWVDLLASETGAECVNAGMNGREIPRSAPAIQLSPEDLLLVMLGTNDLLQGASAKETAARMERFLVHLLPHTRILLVAPPPMQRGAWVPSDELVAESQNLTEEYRLLAHERNIPFVDTRRCNIELTFDGVHFTESGHQAFAKLLKEHLL